jgi:hypothetical protein
VLMHHSQVLIEQHQDRMTRLSHNDRYCRLGTRYMLDSLRCQSIC